MRIITGVPASTFSITPVLELDSIGINVADDDVLFNLVSKDTQLMSGTSPWRRGREKDPILLQMLIESTTQFGDIVLDCTASTGKDFLFKILINLLSFFFIHFFLLLLGLSTGASVHTCQKAGRHFVVLEVDQMIFKDILEPLIVSSFLEVFKKQRLDVENTSEILVDEEFPESSIVARYRFSK